MIQLDKWQVYADTDSLKVQEGYDRTVIDNYNKKVIEKIEKVCKDLEIDKNRFMPKDIKGKRHIIGMFEDETEEGEEFTYNEFITLGAKKYADTKWVKNTEKKTKNKNVIKIENDKALILEITVSGVPKEGAKALKNLKDFKNDFVFDYKDTNKNMLAYNDDMPSFMLTDYNGVTAKVEDKYGCTLVPTTYTLGISQEYADLISDESSTHAHYKE